MEESLPSKNSEDQEGLCLKEKDIFVQANARQLLCWKTKTFVLSATTDLIEAFFMLSSLIPKTWIQTDTESKSS